VGRQVPRIAYGKTGIRPIYWRQEHGSGDLFFKL